MMQVMNAIEYVRDHFHAAALIYQPNGLSVYALSICGKEFRLTDDWVSARVSENDITCSACKRRLLNMKEDAQ